MKDDGSGDHVQGQHGEQGSAVPPVDELPVPVVDDRDGDDQQENDIAGLKKGVKRATRMMELLTAIIAVATAGGVIVAYLQLEAAKANFYRDQRPYVMSLAYPRQFAPGKLILVDFRNGNYGKSPAIKAGGAGWVFFGDDALDRARRWFQNEAPTVIPHRFETIIPPNTPASNIEAKWTTVRSDRPVRAEEMNSLVTKSFSIIAVMRQFYLDTTGHEYWTDTCVSNLANPTDQMVLVECTTLNEVH